MQSMQFMMYNSITSPRHPVAQYPGGLSLWLTLVHLGSSTNRQWQATFEDSTSLMLLGILTMYALPILFLFTVEDCVFVFRQHFLLSRHLVLPSLEYSCSHPIPGQRAVDNGDYIIDKS